MPPTSTMNNDLRTSPRHEFPYEQLVASATDGNMPSLGAFRTVPCENVSSSGIAFLLEEEPDADANEYVVALGKPKNLTYLCARVVHVRRISHKGQLRYRVGCQFTGRARLDRSTLSVVRVDDNSDENERTANQEAVAATVANVR